MFRASSGFYIQSCQKMRYKGDYQPSFLADPVSLALLELSTRLVLKVIYDEQEDYTWHPLDIVCRPLLEKHRYACFSAPERSSNAEVDDDEGMYSISWLLCRLERRISDRCCSSIHRSGNAFHAHRSRRGAVIQSASCYATVQIAAQIAAHRATNYSALLFALLAAEL